MIEQGICYLTLAEKGYPKRLAFLYLEEIHQEFVGELRQDHGEDWRNKASEGGLDRQAKDRRRHRHGDGQKGSEGAAGVSTHPRTDRQKNIRAKYGNYSIRQQGRGTGMLAFIAAQGVKGSMPLAVNMLNLAVQNRCFCFDRLVCFFFVLSFHAVTQLSIGRSARKKDLRGQR